MKHVLGVDSGGSKTLAVVADEHGLVKGIGKSGGSNFQTAGKKKAAEELSQAIDQAMSAARISSVEQAC